jgi:hypothetical protein
MEETWSEIKEVEFDTKSKVVKVSTGKVTMKKVSGDKETICDLCNCKTGLFRDLQSSSIIQPETMRKAIDAGLKPTKSIQKMKKMGLGIPEKELYEGWKQMSLNSETPWHLCDNCLKELNSFTKTGDKHEFGKR